MANIPTANNNPGDLKDPATGTFQQFSDPKQGFGALLTDLQTSINNHPDWTLADFSNTYAPPSDDNDSAGYAAKLANQLGVAPNATISSLSPNIGNFADAVANNEGYQGGSTNITANPGSTDSNATQSNTPNLDSALGLAGAGVGVLGLALPWLLGPEAGVPADVAEEAAAGAGATAESPSLLSKIGSWLTGTAKTAATAAIGGTAIDDLTGNSSGNNAGSSSESQSQTAPTYETPASSVTSAPIQPTNEPSAQPSGNPEQFPVQDQTPQFQDQQIPIATQATGQAAQTITQAMNATPTGRIMMQQPQYQNAITAGATYGAVPTQGDNGTIDSTEAESKRQKAVGDLSDSNSAVLKEEGNTADANDYLAEAHRNIDNDDRIPDAEKGEAKETASRYINAFAAKNKDANGRIPLHLLEKHKKQVGPSAKFDLNDPSSKRHAFRAMYRGAKSTVLKNTHHKDFYSKSLSEEKKLIDYKDVLKKINGKKAPVKKGFMKDLLRSSGRYAGLYLGDKIGGPLGAVLGDMVGQHVIRAADKHYGQTIFDTPAMKKAMHTLEKTHPDIAGRLQKELDKIGVKKQEAHEMANRRGLPAPATQLGPRTGETKSVVVGGKRPPIDFEQAMKRKTGHSEYGFLGNFLAQQKAAQKAAGTK